VVKAPVKPHHSPQHILIQTTGYGTSPGLLAADFESAQANQRARRNWKIGRRGLEVRKAREFWPCSQSTRNRGGVIGGVPEFCVPRLRDLKGGNLDLSCYKLFSFRCMSRGRYHRIKGSILSEMKVRLQQAFACFSQRIENAALVST